MDQDLDFEIGNGNSIQGGCGAILMNQMMYFGGLQNWKKQVCSLKFLTRIVLESR